VSPAQATPGTNVTFTLKVKNNGPGNANNVVVNDVVPSGYTFVSGAPSKGTWAAPNWVVGNIGFNDSVTLTMVVTVQPSGNYVNTATVSATQSDPNATNNTATAAIIFINSTPVANGDLGSVLVEDGPNGTIDILVNDVNPLGGSMLPVNGNGTNGQFSVDLNIAQTGIQNSVVTPQGVWTLNTGNGIVTFNPANNYFGTATLIYELCNPQGLCDTAVITFVVTPVNDPPVATNDFITTPEDTPVSGNVATNDTDVDGPSVIITVVSGPANGSIVLNVNGTFIYTPNLDFSGTDTVVYSYCDGGTPDLCVTARLIITVAPVNDFPVANDDYFTTYVSTPLSASVATNDFDIDGPFQLFILTGNVTNGTLLLNNDGSFTYTPDAGFLGNDTFVYSYCDGANPNLCDNALVVITVSLPLANQSPHATTDTLSTLEDVPCSGNVASNDTDTDGPSVIITLVSGPSNGNILLQADGTFTYSPNPDFNGTDTVVYSYCDGGSPNLCDTSFLVLTIHPVNDAPQAANDLFTTTKNNLITANVSSNDSDIDGPMATYTLLADVANGTLLLNSDGTFTYTPGLDFLGLDSFQYILCDGGTPNLCDTATVVIHVLAVNQAPVANDDDVITNEDEAVSGSVLNNDTDPDGPSVLISLVNGPSNGVVVLNVDGTFTYTPNADFNGTDEFTYSYCDGGSPNLCDTATMSITVLPMNDPPVAYDNYYITFKNTALAGHVLLDGTTDIDIDGNLNISSVLLLTSTINGNTSLLADGTFTYLPANDFVGNDRFSYIVCDLGFPIYCDTAEVYILVKDSSSFPILPDNVFTPNADGINDLWYAIPLDLFPNTKVSIINRWGEKVFESNNYQNDFNGVNMYNGKKLADGSYFYFIQLADSSKPLIKGTITILSAN